jgi:hypothetical protein
VKYADLGFKSFFEDFDKEIREVFEKAKDSDNKKIESGKKADEKSSWG